MCRDVGLKARQVRIPDEDVRKHLPEAAALPRSIVLARLDAGAPRTVHFNGHYDVVPAAENGWKYGAFEPRTAGGWLYGRGSTDMKGPIACLLHAIRAVRDSGRKPSVNLEISFTPDEETDSVFGAAWVVKNKLVKADYVVICEGGSGRNVGCGHNGVLWFEVDVIGRAAHGSQPRQGVNAVEQMSRLVVELTDYSRELETRRFRNPDGRIRTATMNVAGVASTMPGAKINTVPDGASFTVDRRVLPNEDLTEAEGDFRKFIANVCKRNRSLKVRIRKIGEHTATYCDPSLPLLKAFGATLAGVRGESARFTVSTGFNDSHFFAGEAGLPTLGWGPGGEHCHATDERIKISELVAASQVYAEFITSFEG